MDKWTQTYLSGRFKDYYANCRLTFDSDIAHREWGYIPFTTGNSPMIRHNSLKEIGDPQVFLQEENPRHVYASASLYADPSANNMDDKGWTGSDLIFDIDIDEDHLPEGYDQDDDLTYQEMLELSKEHLQRLISILDTDFGFQKQNLKIVFSGGRGYHVHINSDDVRAFDSNARTKIVSYIKGIGVDIDSILRSDWDRVGRKTTSKTNSFKPLHGWGTNIFENYLTSLAQIATLDKTDAIENLQQINGIGPKRATQILSVIQDSPEQLYAGVVQQEFKPFIQHCIENTIKQRYAEIDEPVTTDINRLIRVPGTLHGGHGLVVTELDHTMIDEFQPLTDAVADIFTRYSIAIDVTQPCELEFNGQSHSFSTGETTVSEAVGIHLMCEGNAEKASE
jgi:DNA primase small subunit